MMTADVPSDPSAVHEGYLPVDHAQLYYRVLGQGQPIILLHGGPDFDHTYLLPEMDRLADDFRLIYYDQRGRGKSADGVHPEAVTLNSEIEDVERVRDYLGLESTAVLGHSYGGVLAMAYAIRHLERVSHLILLNTAPASYADWMLLRNTPQATDAGDVEQMRTLISTPEYQAGEPDMVAARYRLHFRSAVKRPQHLEQLIQRLRASFTQEGILKAWAIEDRLDAEIRLSSDFDLFPQLSQLTMPTLVLCGDSDIIPEACSAHIAQVISGARLAVLNDCGHFPYLERPDQFRQALRDFFAG